MTEPVSDVPYHDILPSSEEVLIETFPQCTGSMSQKHESPASSHDVNGIDHGILEAYTLVTISGWPQQPHQPCPPGKIHLCIADSAVSLKEILRTDLACNDEIVVHQNEALAQPRNPPYHGLNCPRIECRKVILISSEYDLVVNDFHRNMAVRKDTGYFLPDHGILAVCNDEYLPDERSVYVYGQDAIENLSDAGESA